MLVLLGGCYSPTIASDVPCAPPGGARCPAHQVCVSRAGVEVCVPEGQAGVDASVDLDAPPLPDGAPADWWDARWTRRRAIDITAGANGVPSGYSIPIVIDHAALVAAGSSRASGDDVRIVRASGALQVDRALDTGASWGQASTKLWFKLTSSLAANATVRYWIYYGNATAGAPPQDPTAVFLQADGFEGATSAWNFDQGVGTSTARAHHGAHAVAIPATTQLNKFAYLDPVDERDVAFDVWWNIDDVTNADMSQSVRGNATSVWFTNLQPSAGAPPTWDISKSVQGTYSEVIPPPQGAATPPADAWFRVTVYAYNQQMAVDVGGARYVPASGFSDIGTTSSGDVGFSVYNGVAPAYFDDITLRRFVLPEPTTTAGAEEHL